MDVVFLAWSSLDAFLLRQYFGFVWSLILPHDDSVFNLHEPRSDHDTRLNNIEDDQQHPMFHTASAVIKRTPSMQAVCVRGGQVEIIEHKVGSSWHFECQSMVTPVPVMPDWSMAEFNSLWCGRIATMLANLRKPLQQRMRKSCISVICHPTDKWKPFIGPRKEHSLQEQLSVATHLRTGNTQRMLASTAF